MRAIISNDTIPVCSPFLELPTVLSSADLPNARKAVHEVADGRALHVKETKAENLKEEISLEDRRLQNLEEETRLEDARLPDFVEARLEEGAEDSVQEKAIQQELLDISGTPTVAVQNVYYSILYRFSVSQCCHGRIHAGFRIPLSCYS